MMREQTAAGAGTAPPTLSDLVPQPVQKTVGGIAIAITPMSWHTAARAFDAGNELLGLMTQESGLADLKRDELMNKLLPVLVVGRDSVAQFLAIAASIDVDDIKALQPAHLVDLFFAVLEVNADFFAQSLPAVVASVAQRMAALQARLEPVLAQAVAAAKVSTTTSSG